MKINMIEARAVSVPVAKPTRIAKRVLDKRDYLIVHVAGDESDVSAPATFIPVRAAARSPQRSLPNSCRPC